MDTVHFLPPLHHLTQPFLQVQVQRQAQLQALHQTQPHRLHQAPRQHQRLHLLRRPSPLRHRHHLQHQLGVLICWIRVPNGQRTVTVISIQSTCCITAKLLVPPGVFPKVPSSPIHQQQTLVKTITIHVLNGRKLGIVRSEVGGQGTCSAHVHNRVVCALQMGVFNIGWLTLNHQRL